MLTLREWEKDKNQILQSRILCHFLPLFNNITLIIRMIIAIENIVNW